MLCSLDPARATGGCFWPADGAGAPVHANDPREDLERLMRDAAEGVPVAGRPATWEAGRPGQLPAGQPVKHRGFIDYSRCARQPRPGPADPFKSAEHG